eukprot:TRINITY_DN4742_c0_g2_i1.p1 TRINITY_DN4742_c0_g2~~TRINITY_DN4742_c0_g2_i1.p1  ORF type:complete len:473 (+),score=74.09 TRINITY_DN4742_c0_g2_i1:116-1420(+)
MAAATGGTGDGTTDGDGSDGSSGRSGSQKHPLGSHKRSYDTLTSPDTPSLPPLPNGAGGPAGAMPMALPQPYYPYGAPGPDMWASGGHLARAGSQDHQELTTLYQDEREVRRQRRKQSNRESARRSRLRKQAENEDLGQRVSSVNTENAALRQEVAVLRERCEHLSAQNAHLLQEARSLGVVLQTPPPLPAPPPYSMAGQPGVTAQMRSGPGLPSSSALPGAGQPPLPSVTTPPTAPPASSLASSTTAGGSAPAGIPSVIPSGSQYAAPGVIPAASEGLSDPALPSVTPPVTVRTVTVAWSDPSVAAPSGAVPLVGVGAPLHSAKTLPGVINVLPGAITAPTESLSSLPSSALLEGSAAPSTLPSVVIENPIASATLPVSAPDAGLGIGNAGLGPVGANASSAGLSPQIESPVPLTGAGSGSDAASMPQQLSQW